MNRSPLPRWTYVEEVGGAYFPRCELCGWHPHGHWHESEARRACRDHARARPHREDADAYARAEARR